MTRNCVELLFIWSKGMGEGYQVAPHPLNIIITPTMIIITIRTTTTPTTTQESLPADLSGLQASEGTLMLRATYRSDRKNRQGRKEEKEPLIRIFKELRLRE